MGNPWFESVAVAQRRAERILPRHVYDALIAGSEAGLTLDDNRAAYRELGFQPVIADRPSERHLATSVVGLDLSMPVMISQPVCRRCIQTVSSQWPGQQQLVVRYWTFIVWLKADGRHRRRK